MLKSAIVAFVAGLAFGAGGALADDSSAAMSEIASFQKPTNDERFTVLTGLLRSHGLAYAVETFDGGSKSSPRTGRNVVVTLGGKGKAIVVGAHYDAHTVDGGGLAPAAVDNAAAVVELVHIAAALKHHEFAHAVKFVFFDQEEIGTIGSTRYVAAHGPSETAAALNVDIAGYGDTLIYSEPAAAVGARLIGLTRALCARRALNCIGYPIFPISDDKNFAEAGIPTLGLALLTRLEAHQMWLILNSGDPAKMGPLLGPQMKLMGIMHTPADTIDKVEPAAVALGQGVFADLLLAVDKALPPSGG